ncbi:hypothetical protein BH23GEM6_BH23GEM6_19360 [soil metagenome]
MNNVPTPRDLEELEEALATGDIRGACAYLNRRAPHRFTGIYRFDGSTLRNIHLVDGENPELEIGRDAPLNETYCSITGSGDVPFSTADAGKDARLKQHPARVSTLSYRGVPLLDDTGRAIGTLCHFDLSARPVPVAEMPLLQFAASIIVTKLRDLTNSRHTESPDLRCFSCSRHSFWGLPETTGCSHAPALGEATVLPV